MTAPAQRVAVTRDEPQHGPLATALRAHSLEPVACPAVREAGTPDPDGLASAARALEEYDWLIASSRRAVDAVNRARGNAPWPPSLRTAAVGASTAAALRACGATPPLLAPAAGALPLIPVLRASGPWRGRRVLFPRAEEGRTELAEALREAGARVDEVIAYRTEPVPPDEVRAAWRRANPVAAVIASPSAARALVAGIGAGALRRLPVVVAIGRTTLAALNALGVRAHAPSNAGFGDVARLVARRLAALHASPTASSGRQGELR